MRLSSGEVTCFCGVLPVEDTADGAARCPSSSAPAAGGLIMEALRPLRSELDAALVRSEAPAVLELAYGALARAADGMAAHRGETLCDGEVLVHALLVELESLPYEPQADGTLCERGTAVSVSYCNWTVDRAQAATWARHISARLQALWPCAWVVVSSSQEEMNAMGVEVGA